MKHILLLGILCLGAAVCPVYAGGGGETEPEINEPQLPVELAEEASILAARKEMVAQQIAGRGIKDSGVLEAMRTVPRHRFMPEQVRPQAYEDHPVPIGEGQTISQPYIVALMTESLNLEAGDVVLEIGTGSGYQAAVLAGLVKDVYTIEIKTALHERASETLERLGYENVHTMNADGYYGWEEHAPYDAIMITAAVDHIPRPLFEQLAADGVMILPLGDPHSVQQLVRVIKTGDDYRTEHITGVLFVPMTGRALE